MRTRLNKAVWLGAGLIVALGLSGCDLQEDADLAKGRSLFISKCGSCHILAEAATTAQIGPDLDAAFADARAAGGYDADTFEGIITSQIENPRLTDPSDPTYMPADLVTGEDLRDVSAYVASVAGVPGIMPPQAPGGPGGQIYANNGCGACHTLAAAQSTGQVGPNLDEVIPGQSPAMVDTSIVDPNAEITAGFEAGVMPENYGDTIDPADLKLLVKFLVDSAGKGGAGGANAGGGGNG